MIDSLLDACEFTLLHPKLADPVQHFTEKTANFLAVGQVHRPDTCQFQLQIKDSTVLPTVRILKL